MDDFFGRLGRMLRPPPRAEKRLAARPQRKGKLGSLVGFVTNLCVAACSRDEEAPLGGLQPDSEPEQLAAKTRAAYNRCTLRALGQEAVRWLQAEEASTRCWRLPFLIHKYGILSPGEANLRRKQLDRALRLVRLNPNGRAGAACSQAASRLTPSHCDPRPTNARPGVRNCDKRKVAPSRRLRREYIRRPICAELMDELFQWFVDRLATNKTRVGTSTLIHVACNYKNAVLNDWRDRCNRGEADPSAELRLPKISRDWVGRFRQRYGITHRTVNIRYKMPRATFLARLKVFWSNIIIVRALYEQFYPGDDLDFVGFDQKPLWFNSVAADKTLSMKGASRVGVAENVSASRARFTAMTQCRSWTADDVPPIGVLFKIGDAASSLPKLHAEMECRPSTLLQGAPRGSYRLSQVLAFLKWAVPSAPERGKPVCVVLDWFSPHLDKEVDALVHEQGNVVLRIGGGLTPTVQVPDTHAHRPYNNHYRQLERDAASAAWDLRPGTLLECSKQSVLARSEDAWALVDHNACAAGWVHNGITNKLDGSQDESLASHTRPHWDELEMTTVREQLVQDVKEMVESGQITSFGQYHELLLPYDDHPPVVEGMEGAPVYVYDESGAHAPLGTDDWEHSDEDGGDYLDALIAREETELAGLQPGSGTAVGTSSPRVLEPIAPSGMHPDLNPPLSDRLRVRSGLESPGPPPHPIPFPMHFALSGGLQPDATPPQPPPLPPPPDDDLDDDELHHRHAPPSRALQPDLGGAGLRQEGVPSEPLPPPPPLSGVEETSAGESVAKRRRVIDALCDAQSVLRSVGQIQIADYLQAQARRHVSDARGADPHIVAVLRRQTDLVARTRVDARARDAEARTRMAEKKIELKIAEEQRLAASHAAKEEQARAKAASSADKTVRQAFAAEAKERSNAAKLKEDEVRKASEALKRAQDNKKKEQEYLRARWPSKLAEAMSDFMLDPKLGVSRRKALLDLVPGFKEKVAWKRVRKLPVFWDHGDRRGMQCISLKNLENKYTDPMPVYATEKFSWEMWQHRKPNGPSQPQLSKFMERVMPGYAETVGVRYPAKDLLRDASGNADVAFLMAAFYYSSVFPAKEFPCGLRRWPPVFPPDYFSAAPAACAAASSSAASSSAPPPAST